ncbi:hypothetical protein ASPZODRAFT_129722 [Penicilliopsis zonata CBS 506.65]|uniref:Uncharacterized protein n=1 Tax=Penicilliopsis zonata CBS 506.65 TaxID=1073090 RepID=A0A1L9SPX9_9EURO|nr:hypothetical protein ASPZODRAFT_129722 [Penicilliopsis zonata CBS 506.65]OJJ49285.1 hypothetical protein ASPZODRAFT_129722 [Penicilliopsis zonata CBS 506.65]
MLRCVPLPAGACRPTAASVGRLFWLLLMARINGIVVATGCPTIIAASRGAREVASGILGSVLFWSLRATSDGVAH